MGNSNTQLVKNAVNEFKNGNSQGYIDYLHDDFYGKIWSGLIPGGDEIKGKGAFINFMKEMNNKIEIKRFEPINWVEVEDTVYFRVKWEFIWKETNTLIRTSANVRKVIRDGKIVEKYHLINYNDIKKDLGRVNKDLLLAMDVQNFDDWYEVFSQHSTRTTLAINKTIYNPEQARSDFMDESRTEVWRDIDNPDKVIISCFEVNVPKMVYFCKEDPETVRITRDFGWVMETPMEMKNIYQESINSQESMFCYLEVESSERWIKGFQEHGNSGRITGLLDELPITRSKLCDECQTRIFKHAWKSNWVAVLMYNVKTDKFRQLQEDERMIRLTKFLGEKKDTKVSKILKELDI